MKRKKLTNMKRKLFLFTVSALLLLFSGYGCSDDDGLSDRDIQQMIDASLNGQWKIIPVEIKPDDWVWYEDEKEAYYRVTIDLPELKDYIFDEGATLAYYRFNQNAKTALPYVKTTIGDNGVPFTETYSCDFELGNPSTATFYLESSDAGKYDGNPPGALFQIVLIY
ncbi:MAG: hypothetical protein PHD28_06340 [Proteiniphilum sp.]|nr:hypothetical protein [Proteiniphilum sp.]